VRHRRWSGRAEVVLAAKAAESLSHAGHRAWPSKIERGAAGLPDYLGSRFEPAHAARELTMLIVLLAFLAISPDTELASWVEAQGGVVTKDAAAHVVAIDLRSSWVTDSDLSALEQLRYLKKLDLSYTHITDLGMEQLKPLQGITELNLCYAEHVTDEGLAHLKGWKKLEWLNVRGTKITDTGLEHISTLGSLRWLDAGFAQITNNGLDYLSALTNLRHLGIGGNKISDSGLH